MFSVLLADNHTFEAVLSQGFYDAVNAVEELVVHTAVAQESM